VYYRIFSAPSLPPYLPPMGQLPSLLTLGVALPTVGALHCAFLHGAGNAAPPQDLAIRRDYRGYWGALKDAVPCDSYSFMYGNTVSGAWYTSDLMALACATALDHPYANLTTAAPRRDIHDTVVFTHSMGNLLFAFALEQGVCRLGPTSWWAAAAGPWMGSVAADNLLAYCNGTRPWSAEIKEVSDALHLCVGRNLSHSNYAMQTWFPGLPALAAVSRRHVRAALCGRSALGLPSPYSPLMAAVSRLMAVPGPDDGMVTVESCQAGAPRGARWGENPASLFYLGDMNHADSTGRDGDSRKGVEAQMPCAWYRNIVRAHRSERAAAAAAVTEAPWSPR